LLTNYHRGQNKTGNGKNKLNLLPFNIITESGVRKQTKKKKKHLHMHRIHLFSPSHRLDFTPDSPFPSCYHCRLHLVHSERPQAVQGLWSALSGSSLCSFLISCAPALVLHGLQGISVLPWSFSSFSSSSEVVTVLSLVEFKKHLDNAQRHRN